MKKYIADILTFSRIIFAIFLIVWGIVGGSIGVACAVFLLAELTDSFDGTCSRKWPFEKGKEPRYRKYAVQFDIVADMLLWFSAVLFFTLRVNLIVGLSILFGVGIICGILELIIYGRFFAHPDTCTKNSLCAKNFKLAKKIIMTRRFFYLGTIAFVAIWLLFASEWSFIVDCCILGVIALVGIFLWFFLETRRKNVSRDAIELEQEMLKKSQK